MTSQTLLEQYLQDADAERQRVARGKQLISRDECVVEMTQLGKLRWYLHDRIDDPVTKSLYFFELEIPAGSRSGKVKCQGNIVCWVLSGNGHTELDGERHEWGPEDVIGLPTKEYGLTYQHFNTGEEPARLLVCWPNLDSALGAGAGVEFDIVEPAPEYEV
jgi:hypothetical protein